MPRDDHQVAETAEIGNDIRDNALAEVDVGGVTGNILEGQNCN